jgi:hypothetical protein
MLKKTVTYTDYFGIEKTEDLYFHLSRPEVVELEVGVKGGYSELLKTIAASDNNQEIVATFKKILLMSYGEKSDDGKQFRKSDEIRDAFTQTAAYEELFMEFLTDEKEMLAFVTGILPSTEGLPQAPTGTRPATQDHMMKALPEPEVVRVPTAADIHNMTQVELEAEIARRSNQA